MCYALPDLNIPAAAPPPHSRAVHTFPCCHCKAVFLTFQLAGSAVIAFGLWFRFGGTMKDFSSEDKSPEYFYVGE